jgi:MFS family permease
MSVLGAYRGLLSNGPITRLLVGEFVSSIGDWLYLVALLIVVYRETTDTVVLGIVGAARIVPYVLLSVPAGIAADRFDRRLVLLVTDLARGAIMVVLAWLVAVDAPVIWLVALAILATCFSTFFGPAIGSYIPSLVRDERELGPANSAWSTLDSLSYVIGPAVAGILIAVGDLVPAFILNAISFGFVAIILWGLPSSKGGLGSQAVEGAADGPEAAGMPPEEADAPSAPPAAAAPSLRSVGRPLVGLSVLDVVASFVYGGLAVLTVVIATDHLGVGDQATGYLNAAIGVGGMLGAVGAGILVLRRDLAPVLLVGAFAMALGLAALGAMTALAAALVAMAVIAAGDLLASVVSTTVFQRVVPDAIRGRALGAIATASTLAAALGSLALPILATAIGIFPVLAASAVLVAVAAVVTVILARDGMRRSPDEAGAALLRVRTLPIFAGVPPTALELAASRTRPLDVASGAVVIRQGDPADRFYIVERGRFAVDQMDPRTGDERRLRVMEAGEVFGELGLLRRGPRSATITALEDGRVLWMNGPDFLELVSAGPGLGARLIDLRRGTIIPGGPDPTDEPLTVSPG